MNDELRNILGKALYEACADFSDDSTPSWDELSEDTYYPWMRKSAWIARAEKVIEAYLQHIRSERGEHFDGNGDLILPDYVE